ncbi:hypothetical protein S58_47050 [Bradyrhizobium oligotrophicum S58]|uniref:Uncharacterized protein n=1 Tax=Bradyrhizobium oligotrophicum S58 TaxID=1245469 RepID=M4ZWG5_9BRAD|nr:hypothetical protein [Bradyrhizobium oligotrophicum]BAM90685.1 hypothetical protein S58_47050 [Bradyrhizobium oligotrophicum S58]
MRSAKSIDVPLFAAHLDVPLLTPRATLRALQAGDDVVLDSGRNRLPLQIIPPIRAGWLPSLRSLALRGPALWNVVYPVSCYQKAMFPSAVRD